MKFSVCGGSEPPDWILADISKLGILTESNFDKFIKVCGAEMISASDNDHSTVNIPQPNNASQNKKKMTKEFLKSIGLEINDPYNALPSKKSSIIENNKSTSSQIACVMYLLKNACSQSLTPSHLIKELQQLGLPNEHSLSFSEYYILKKSILSQHLKNKSIWLQRVVDHDWYLDFIWSCSTGTVLKPFVYINLKTKQPVLEQKISFDSAIVQSTTLSAESTIPLNMSIKDAKILLTELKRARKVVQNLKDIEL